MRFLIIDQDIVMANHLTLSEAYAYSLFDNHRKEWFKVEELMEMLFLIDKNERGFRSILDSLVRKGLIQSDFGDDGAKYINVR